MQGAWTGVFRGTGVRLCRILDMNFYEKALFVKPTWRPYIVAGAVAGALCAMLLSALLAGQLSLVTRCIG
jgi:hypothetical protein